MKSIDIVASSFLENLSNYIEFDDNLCQDVRIVYPYEPKDEVNKIEEPHPKAQSVFGYGNPQNSTFGYEKAVVEPKTKMSKCLIVYTPETRFLRRIGISYDSLNGTIGELPIISFFKSEDNVIKDVIVEVVTRIMEKDIEVIEVEKRFIVSDIKSVGFGNTMKYIYILTPKR